MENSHSPVLTALEKQHRMVGAWIVARIFTHVDFSDTLFEKARCDDAKFVGVDLRRADFRGAFLTNVLFLRCELAGARFPGAQLAQARFIACTGLEADAARALRGRGAQVLD